MILQGGLKYSLVGNYDITSIKKILVSNNLEWDSYQFRQKRYKDHSATKTIPIIWSEKFKEQEFWEPNYSIFKGEVTEIEEFIRKNLCNAGGFMSLILINLPAGKSIERHIDANPMGERFNRCHRLHIPIITNPYCLFEMDGETKNMKEGEVWEISNVKLPHSVQNKGTSDRIHLLIDWDPFI